MALSSLLPLFLLIGTCATWVQERPVLETRDGNLLISSAKDRNISLLTFGASVVNINDINLVEVSTSARKAAQTVERWEKQLLGGLQKDVLQISHDLSVLQQKTEFGGDGTTNSTAVRPGRPTGENEDFASSAALGQLTNRVRRVERGLRIVRMKLRENGCAGTPCQNGGTCIRVFDGFQCICPSNWEGSSCESDVNECANFAGTDLGCQNGATCRNLPGAYRCFCADGWHGIHCTTKLSKCEAQDSTDLCGHGTCVPTKDNGYTCICNQGWESDASSPACDKDVNECAGKHPPCSMSPLVPCINTNGGYRCGGCPAGYTGNGHYCNDINECLIDNGGCSTSPRVDCINTIGSWSCGNCPAGYQGDGVTCTYVGACRINNGGCSPLATCVETSGYVQCNCMAGYHGTGVGPQGCRVGTDMISPCSVNPCIHGTCVPNGAGFICRCNPGFTGIHCESGLNPCSPNPCQNGGTCRVTSSGAATCNCTSAFLGSRCETRRQSCSALYKNPSGTLEYPSNGQLYEHGLNCAFVILTNMSMVLNITITRFDLEKSQNCRFDFLQIHDGQNAGAHQMGRFCGTDLPFGGNFMTTHNAVYFWLRTDNDHARGGFALRWESVPPTCGGLLTADHGRIASPGSPGQYPHNRDCRWDVYVRPGKRIQFHFFSVMLEQHPTCENDYLEINETAGNRMVQLGLYCNHTHPAPLLTSGPQATLHFHSDGSGSDTGFQISYTTVEGIPGCGGVYTADQGIISTPQYPSTYEPNLNCDWKIQLPKGGRVRLTWIALDIEPQRICRYDAVQVFSGPDTDSPVVGRYCGDNLPSSVIVDSNIVLIVFTSDWSHERTGFQLKYEIVCGGEFRDLTGILKSPYYPQKYPGGRTCIYEIIQPVGKGIVLTIVDLDTEGTMGTRCNFDGLEIFDGDNENATRVASLCGGAGRIPGEPFISTHNYMYLKFFTDRSNHYRGFLANYTTVDRGCGGLLKEPSGLLQSHTEGSTYNDNEDCTWTLKAPKGYIVQLTFTTFSLEGGHRCSSDYVMVFDTSSNNQEMGRYCGQTVPPILTTQGEIMTVQFHTDYSVSNEGFIAHYIFVDASRVCGGHFFTTTGVLTSPNYPRPYPVNKECTWIITAPHKQIITLEVNEFEVEGSGSCYFDYLEIRNGGNVQAPLIGKYCGTDIPRRIKSFTHEIFLKFVTDASLHKGGFNISWDASSAGCGGVLNGFKGEIFSPGYPQHYSRLANCLWTIAVSAGSTIQILFIDFNLEGHERCRYDYLEISESRDERRRVGTRYCGTNHPSTFISHTNFVSLRMRSDYSTSDTGFHLRYETMCNNKVRGFNGVIESPNFPNVYPDNANCTWTIEAPRGNKINVTFSHFHLEDRTWNENCTFDYVEISEGESDVPNTELGKFCGEDRPGRVSSTTNQMFVHFRTDRYTGHEGFRLEWVVVGCGGHLTRPTGEVSSPNYPNAYENNIECEWLIEVEYGHSVEISFLDVDTEKFADCKFDKIQLYGGADATAPLLAQFCHSEQIMNFTSTSNKLFIKLDSDYSFAGRGFTAVYRTVDITCGGKFHAPQGIIHSTNYPKNYPNNQNCEWLISVDMNHLVNLTIMDLDIEDTTNCTDDHVEVFDGSSRDDMSLGKFCRSDIPPSIISSGNTMLVVMRTDSLITSKGFKALFNKACGARIVTDGSGVLESTSLLHMSGDEVNCTWTIIAKDPADHVTLNFVHLDFGNDYDEESGCESHYVQVYEGDGMDGPSRGQWCGSKAPPAIVSTGYALTVHLFTGYQLGQQSFGATYSVLDSSCGGEYYAASASFASPNYPENYAGNATCVWLLKTSPGNRISLTFSDFELEQSPNCDLDYLEIREESGIGKLIGTYCTEAPAPIESSKELWIKFRSDSVGSAKGFRGDYTFLHGNELTGMRGSIASPLYPYPWKLSDDIHWRITVGFGLAVRIEFEDVHIERMYDSCLSKVTIYDGYDENAPVITDVCGTTPPEAPITSSSNVVYIQFSSEWVRESNLWKLNWYQVPREPSIDNGETRVSECEVEYDMTSIGNHTDIISSPGYPDGYKPNLDCTWVITTTPGSHLNLRFLRLDLEESRNCVHDYASIYHGNGLAQTLDDTQLIAKVCRANDTNQVFKAKTVMTLKFHSDFFINGTGMRAFVWRECGGDLSGPDGVIDFNVTKRMFDRRMTIFLCEWNITVRQGKTIKVEFTDFKIGNTEPAGCKENYILLKNGAGPESPLLGAGKFCGERAPTEQLLTSGNKLYVKAVGPWSVINFKLTYSEVGMDCGGSHILNEEQQQVHFSTPNHPNIPPPFSECFWTFMAPSGGRLSLHFTDRFDLTGPNCTKEYVEIRDGGTEHSVLLGRFCGDVAPSSLSSTGNMLYVHFYTEVPVPKNGFSGVVTTGELCGGILRGKTGVIRSPNYPAVYPINQMCGWFIDGPPDHTLKLEFRDLHLPSLRRCESGSFVTIREKTPLNNTVYPLGTFCGSTKPGVLETESNEAVVSFRSSNRTNTYYRGFVLNYTASRERCGGKLSGLSGEFKTPNYPNPNARSRYCDWSITVPEGSQAVLEILDLDIKESDSGPYALQLAISNEGFSRSLITVIQKVPYPKKIYGTSRYLTVRFYYTPGHRGLRARYSAAAPVPCGGPSEEVSGSLLPPGPPYNASTFFCQWKLKAPDTMMSAENITRTTLTLTITGMFGTFPQERSHCAYKPKFIRLSDGVHKLGAACGNLSGKTVMMRSPAPINIVDILDGPSDGSTNFDVKYEWKACGGILTGPSHVIRSPNTMAFPHSCVWHAKFDDPGATLRLTFNRINLGSCTVGYIIVRNGGPSSPQIGKYCGNIKPSNITSSKGELWIEYWASQAPGDFEIGLDQVTGSCGGTIRGSNKEILSPGFPISYPNNTECTWEIIAELGHTIGFSFVDRFSIETSDGCKNDFVQLFDWVYDDKGIGNWQEHPKLCGRDRPRDFNSTTNRLKVLFRTNGAVQGDGFRAIWEENCGGLFEASKRPQFIESPNYPDTYPPNKVCNYTITAPKGQKVWLEFLHFKLEGRQGRCKWDNVTIITQRYRPMRDVWCGDAMPQTINSDGTITVLFKSDGYVSKSGFQFKFFVNECGGNITEPTEIGPPTMKDGNYFASLNCTWVITAPEDKSVVLRFNKFDLRHSETCFAHSVNIAEGTSIAGKRLARLCGNITDPFPVRSVGNTMTVSFLSDRSNQVHAGMRAEVIFVKSIESGCGGSVHVREPTTFRTQKSAMYEDFEDCHWSISAEAGKIITLTINTMDLKNKPNSTGPGCQGDYLEVHDGMGPFSDLIGKYCGSESIPPIKSSLNNLWIRFYTDGSLIGEGVTATLTATDSPCGKNVWDVGNDTLTMKSPGYPEDFPAGMQCRWKFMVPDSPYTQLRVHFEELNLEDSENCVGDHFEISDEPNKYIAQDFGEDMIYNGKHSHHFFGVSLRGPFTRMRYGSAGTFSYCGQLNKFEYHSSSNIIHVILKTTVQNLPKPRKYKFEVEKASCNRNYTAEQGRILHQGFAECWTTITTESNRTISVYFTKFRMYDANNCSGSFMQIYQGDSKAPNPKKFCGLMVPSPIFSTGNVLTLHSKSSRSGRYGGANYDMIFTTTDKGPGCGGRIFNYEGTFTSPMYPMNYRNESMCQWEISVPRGFQVALQFRLFDIGTVEICQTDYLEIVEQNLDAGRTEKYCPGQTPATFRANTNVVTVTYVSSVNNGGTGWIINFRAIHSTDSLHFYRPMGSGIW